MSRFYCNVRALSWSRAHDPRMSPIRSTHSGQVDRRSPESRGLLGQVFSPRQSYDHESQPYHRLGTVSGARLADGSLSGMSPRFLRTPRCLVLRTVRLMPQSQLLRRRSYFVHAATISPGVSIAHVFFLIYAVVAIRPGGGWWGWGGWGGGGGWEIRESTDRRKWWYPVQNYPCRREQNQKENKKKLVLGMPMFEEHRRPEPRRILGIFPSRGAYTVGSRALLPWSRGWPSSFSTLRSDRALGFVSTLSVYPRWAHRPRFTAVPLQPRSAVWWGCFVGVGGWVECWVGGVVWVLYLLFYGVWGVCGCFVLTLFVVWVDVYLLLILFLWVLVGRYHHESLN